jgi:hypothetical protein
MRRAIPPSPHTLSWRGAQLKKAQGQLYLYLNINIIFLPDKKYASELTVAVMVI